MRTLKKLSILAAILAGIVTLQACDDGAFEDTGEKIDRAAEDVADSVEDACEEVTDENC